MATTDSTALVARLRELLTYDPSTGILRWRVGKSNVKAGSVAGGLNDQGYILLRVDRVAMRAHRVAWAIMTGSIPTLEIDHKNRIRSDNRWENLREVTHAQNFENLSMRKDCRHGFRGIELHSSGLWKAQLTINKKRIRLGYFKTPEEAFQARLAGEAKYFKNQRVA
jgi:hypothetical protein